MDSLVTSASSSRNKALLVLLRLDEVLSISETKATGDVKIARVRTIAGSHPNSRIE